MIYVVMRVIFTKHLTRQGEDKNKEYVLQGFGLEASFLNYLCNMAQTVLLDGTCIYILSVI